jgi:hypothetical protein
MAHLDKLKVSNRVIAARTYRRRMETDEHRRNKLVANVEEQIELAQLAIQGRPQQLQRKRGHSIVTVRPRIWWKTEPDGKVFAEIRYNKVPLDIGGRGCSIEVGSLKSLPQIYRTVIRAIKAGELDPSIRAAIRKSRS